MGPRCRWRVLWQGGGEFYGADYFCGNLHKWLCNVRGSGFLVLRPNDSKLRSATEPLVASHGYGGGFTSDFIWQGASDYSPWLAVPSCLEWWRSVGGIDQAVERNNELLVGACELLAVEWQTQPLLPSTGSSLSMALSWSCRFQGKMDEGTCVCTPRETGRRCKMPSSSGILSVQSRRSMAACTREFLPRSITSSTSMSDLRMPCRQSHEKRSDVRCSFTFQCSANAHVSVRLARTIHLGLALYYSATMLCYISVEYSNSFCRVWRVTGGARMPNQSAHSSR